MFLCPHQRDAFCFPFLGLHTIRPVLYFQLGQVEQRVRRRRPQYHQGRCRQRFGAAARHAAERIHACVERNRLISFLMNRLHPNLYHFKRKLKTLIQLKSLSSLTKFK